MEQAQRVVSKKDTVISKNPGSTELVREIVIAKEDGAKTKLTLDIERVVETRTVPQSVADRLKMPKFGISRGVARGEAEVGHVTREKEETHIIHRELGEDVDVKEQLMKNLKQDKQALIQKRMDQYERERQAQLDAQKKEEIKKYRGNDDCKIIIKGFDSRVIDDSKMREMFNKVGRVIRCNIPTDQQTGKKKEFCIIEFEQTTAVDKAIEVYNDFEMGYFMLNVQKMFKRTR